MNIIEKLLGEGYPKLGSEVFADGNKTVVTVSRTLSPDHVDWMLLVTWRLSSRNTFQS